MSEPAGSQYGGQALIEGVMIRGKRHVCVACRELAFAEDGSTLPPAESPVFVESEVISTFAGRLAKKFPPARWPFVRGSLVLLESMELGSKGLRLSASVALGANPTGAPVANSRQQIETGAEDRTDAQSETPTSAPGGAPILNRLLSVVLMLCVVGVLAYGSLRLGWFKQPSVRIAVGVVAVLALGLAVLLRKERQEEAESGGAHSLGELAVGATMVLGLAMGIGIFFMVPNLIVELFAHWVKTPWGRNLVEGLVRVVLFFGYLLLIARLPNIHRIFQYHGAEHQVIHVHENGLELTPENAARFSTVHPRCGTAFLAIVLVTSTIVFMFSGWQVWWVRSIVRLVLLPPIAGISYELLKWNSRRPNFVLKAFAAPGLWFQKITTQPPSRDQVEVAIAAMGGVLLAELSEVVVAE